LQVSGSRLLVQGCWLLVAGCRLKVQVLVADDIGVLVDRRF
jgi:hypothetical protein